jgi:endonuclease-3 related protein
MRSGQEHKLYGLLFKAYGPQAWWPADTPFEVMLGAILTQNTAWTNVEKAIANLKTNDLLDAHALTELAPAVLADLIRPSGYFNVKARRIQSFCQWYLQQGGYDVLSRTDTDGLRKGLLSVHGIGPETADDMLLYAFQRPVFVIDAYTRRLFARTGLASSEETYDTLRRQVEKALNDKVSELNEFHALIVRHAKDYCRKKPLCPGCSVQNNCDFGQQVNNGL